MGISVGASPTVRRCAPRARKCIAGGHFSAEPGPLGAESVFGGCSCARSPIPCDWTWRLPLMSLPALRSPQVGMMIRMGPDAQAPELHQDGRVRARGSPKMGISVGASPTVRRCAPRARKCIAGGHFSAEPGPLGAESVFGGCSSARNPSHCARTWRLPLRSRAPPTVAVGGSWYSACDSGDGSRHAARFDLCGTHRAES
jgi:hypothetical protein